MVAEQLSDVRSRMAAAAARAGRDIDEVTLVAVSKGHSAAAVMEAYDAGHRDFGENRAAELADKAPPLPSDIRWHFIGSLQTRQVKTAEPHSFLLHSMDRLRLANRWGSVSSPPPALIQVNVAGEEQKHGVAPEEASMLVEQATAAGVDCVGLMCIPPWVRDAEENRRWFVELRQLRDRIAADWPAVTNLSMGMTDDYEVAIEEGATLIRVGRAIFESPGGPARID